MKVFVSGDEVHTGQVFFGAGAKHAVYAQGRYAARGQSETSNRADGIYREGATARCWSSVARARRSAPATPARS